MCMSADWVPTRRCVAERERDSAVIGDLRLERPGLCRRWIE